MIRAVVFDMFETLVTLFEGRTYFRKTSGNPRFFKCRDESDLIFINTLTINTMQESDEIYEQLFVFSCFFISYVVYYMHERKSDTLSHICVQYQLPCGMVCKIPSQSPGY